MKERKKENNSNMYTSNNNRANVFQLLSVLLFFVSVKFAHFESKKTEEKKTTKA